MSFGVSSTVYAGHTLLEQAVDRLYENGIVGVAAAGDAGPSSLTIASPSTAFNGLSVGGYNAAANDRIIRDLTIGPGAGLLYRPFSGTESYVFSSRGPTADGRVLPRVVASAVGNFGQGFCPSQTADAWQSKRPEYYRVVFDMSGDRVETGRFEVTVQGSEVISLRRNGKVILPGRGQDYSMDGLFRMLVQEVDLVQKPTLLGAPEGYSVYAMSTRSRTSLNPSSLMWRT